MEMVMASVIELSEKLACGRRESAREQVDYGECANRHAVLAPKLDLRF
jgi:hypothetical protein